MKIDRWDIVTAAGLFVFLWGLWQIWPVTVYLIIGMILFFIGVLKGR
ncbi:MAG: hypothetical protein PHS93_07575 [Candidatus Omnitrophica bacterium]|nr:hypothetical protein [Candidatus Omnitrophota bacterium]